MAASKSVSKFYSEHLYTSKTFVSLQCVYQSRFLWRIFVKIEKEKELFLEEFLVYIINSGKIWSDFWVYIIM